MYKHFHCSIDYELLKSLVISFLLCMPLKPIEKTITFVHADFPVEFNIILPVVQMFYFPISGYRIILSPSVFVFSVSLLVF